MRILLLATDDSSSCVLRQQIFWSLGLAANPTWSSPQDSREKEGEKERERGIEKKARRSIENSGFGSIWLYQAHIFLILSQNIRLLYICCIYKSNAICLQKNML